MTYYQLCVWLQRYVINSTSSVLFLLVKGSMFFQYSSSTCRPRQRQNLCTGFKYWESAGSFQQLWCQTQMKPSDRLEMWSACFHWWMISQQQGPYSKWWVPIYCCFLTKRHRNCAKSFTLLGRLIMKSRRKVMQVYAWHGCSLLMCTRRASMRKSWLSQNKE